MRRTTSEYKQEVKAMKKEEKREIINTTICELNGAKDRIYEAVQKLQDKGMVQDAEILMKIIYKIEALQNKYDL